MQSNNNAGIIVYRDTKMPQVLSLLAHPKLENSLVISGGAEDVNIHIFDCPVNGHKLDKKRYRLLREMVDRNRIKFLVERFEAPVQSYVTPRKNELHYSQLLAEIKAIKQLAALLKLSQDKQENLLSGNIGFIMGKIDCMKIDLLSEEAASVMVYEAPFVSEEQKTKLHNDFMEKKGVSIIFTKNIKDIIDNSSVISIDEEIDLSHSLEALKSKVIIGRSSTKDLKTIDNIILWNEELKMRDRASVPVIYNNEILAIMRYYNIKLDIIDFIKTLPYIYLNVVN